MKVDNVVKEGVLSLFVKEYLYSYKFYCGCFGGKVRGFFVVISL